MPKNVVSSTTSSVSSLILMLGMKFLFFFFLVPKIMTWVFLCSEKVYLPATSLKIRGVHDLWWFLILGECFPL
jgi:hypothetical protein